MANFPTSLPNLKTDYADNVDDVMADNQNEPNGEINAIGNYIGANGDSLFTNRTAKTTPSDSDVMGLNDAAASNVLKKISWANIKTALKSYFDTLYVATGTVVDFAGSTAPTGWLLCDGSEVSRTTYAALFAVIGTTYGSGDGSTTFNLPDARGKATVGYKSGDSDFGALGNVAAGEKRHTLTAEESGIPAHNHADYGHTHGVNDPAHGHSLGNVMCPHTGGGNAYRISASGYDGPAPYAAASYTGISIQTGWSSIANNSSASASQSHNNIQPSIVFNKIIKY